MLAHERGHARCGSAMLTVLGMCCAREYAEFTCHREAMTLLVETWLQACSMCVSLLIVISLILFNFMQESRLVVVCMTFYISFGTFCFMNIHITLFPTMQSVQYSPHTTEAESVRLSGVQCEGQGTDYYAHLKHWVAGDEDYLFSWFHHWRGVSFILKRMWHYIKAKFSNF